MTQSMYDAMTQNCTHYVTSRGYVTHHLTEEEREFPIAYSILTFKDIEMFERLLRAIYRPQHSICVHVDRHSHRNFLLAVQGIVGCFTNVFMAPRIIDVQWGWFSGEFRRESDERHPIFFFFYNSSSPFNQVPLGSVHGAHYLVTASLSAWRPPCGRMSFAPVAVTSRIDRGYHNLSKTISFWLFFRVTFLWTNLYQKLLK